MITVREIGPRRSARRGAIDWNGTREHALRYMAEVGLDENPDELIKDIGVGKQQLVEIAKALAKDVKLLILDEPTRGIDVGAKYEIYTFIHALAAQGKAVVVIPSELPELLGITDRIYTIFEGDVTGCLPTAEADQETLMHLMTSSSTN